MNEQPITKQELRRQIREAKKQFSAEQLRQMSAEIAQKITDHNKTIAAETILLYNSLPDEVYTHDIIELLFQRGKQILLPKVTGEGEMELRYYEGPESLVKGAFNIEEPTGKLFDFSHDIDVAFIPGMAFDLDGNRLGRGKGYYDRFLSRSETIHKIGVCFDFQKVEYVPHEATDIKMDELL